MIASPVKMVVNIKIQIFYGSHRVMGVWGKTDQITFFKRQFDGKSYRKSRENFK
jgi:hypothetical protein